MFIDKYKIFWGVLVCGALATAVAELPDANVEEARQIAAEQKLKQIEKDLPAEVDMDAAEARSIKDRVAEYLDPAGDGKQGFVTTEEGFAYKQETPDSLVAKFSNTSKGLICPARQNGTLFDSLPTDEVVLFKVTDDKVTRWTLYREDGLTRMNISPDGKGRKIDLPTGNNNEIEHARGLCSGMIKAINVSKQLREGLSIK